MIEKLKNGYWTTCDKKTHCVSLTTPETVHDAESASFTEAAESLSNAGWDVRNGKTICPKCKKGE